MRVGGIYLHPCEGVCILADILPDRYRFFALDICAQYPARQKEPREFYTEQRELKRPHVSLKLKFNAFLLDSIVFYEYENMIHWAHFVSKHEENITLYKDHKSFDVDKNTCFQVYRVANCHAKIIEP